MMEEIYVAAHWPLDNKRSGENYGEVAYRDLKDTNDIDEGGEGV